MELPEAAKAALKQRREDRKRTRVFIQSAQADQEGNVRDSEGEIMGEFKELACGVYYLKIKDGKKGPRENIATELFSVFLPDALVIIEATPLKLDRSH